MAAASTAQPTATLAPGHSFAERLWRVGAEFEVEVKQASEAAVHRAQREARLLRDEVEWLQRQLEDERHQSSVRLGLCTDLKRQIEEVQQTQQQESQAKEYWQHECAAIEERHSIAEAKLAALALSEAEGFAGPAPVASAAIDEREPSAALRHGANGWGEAAKKNPPLSADDVERNLQALEAAMAESIGNDAASGECELVMDADALGSGTGVCTSASDGALGLLSLGAEDVHAMLVAAVCRRKGAGLLVQRVLRLWVGQLLNHGGAAAVRAAVRAGSREALATLLGLGGVAIARAAVGDVGTNSGASSEAPCALRLCVERENQELLLVLLDHLRGGGEDTLASVRKAYSFAMDCGKKSLAASLASHLVVELSLLGNAKYRSACFNDAIACYSEAITMCLEGIDRDHVHLATGSGETFRARENLVRLRYNLARAWHRTDEWTKAREEATAVLDLDPNYINAYALRAQAAMSAMDWLAAQSDWDRLVAICSIGSGVGASAAANRSSGGAPSEEVINAWRRRREECRRQMSVGHYEALELERLASMDEVRRAYRDLARRWHPDKHQHRNTDLQERAARRFGRIREAYEVLSDESSKRAYDAVLMLRETKPLTPGREAESDALPSTPGDSGAPAESPISASSRNGLDGELPSGLSFGPALSRGLGSPPRRRHSHDLSPRRGGWTAREGGAPGDYPFGNGSIARDLGHIFARGLGKAAVGRQPSGRRASVDSPVRGGVRS